jgi:hypothetical protein
VTGAGWRELPGSKLAQPIIPLIMGGGAVPGYGRASRENRPKQFLPLFGPHSTFQETIRRVADPALFARPIVVTNGQYRFLVAEQLAAIGAEADILLEPVRRDSGPAIVAGAAYAVRRGGDPVVVARRRPLGVRSRSLRQGVAGEPNCNFICSRERSCLIRDFRTPDRVHPQGRTAGRDPQRSIG